MFIRENNSQIIKLIGLNYLDIVCLFTNSCLIIRISFRTEYKFQKFWVRNKVRRGLGTRRNRKIFFTKIATSQIESLDFVLFSENNFPK